MKSSRAKKGQAIVELPLAISTFMLVLLLPMLNMATFAMRVTNVFAAAKHAAIVAGRSKDFDLARSSAVGRAIESNSKALAGVDIKAGDIKVFIVASPLVAGKSEFRQETALTDADPKSYLYQVEVEVTGRIQPLFTLNKGIFGSVPGLTEPMIITSRSRELCERPGAFVIKP